MMKEIHDFRQIFLGFIFTGHIGKMNAIGRGNIDFHLIFRAKHERIPTAPAHQFTIEIIPDAKENQDRQDPGNEKVRKGRILFLDDLIERNIGFMQAFCQLRIIDDTSPVLITVFVFEQNLIFFNFHTCYRLIIGHVHKGAIIDILDALLIIIRFGNGVEHKNNRQCYNIIKQHGLLFFFDFFHDVTSLLYNYTLCFLL